MQTDYTPLLQEAIGSLEREGTKPSVALVKARLTQPVPMPVIISALQRWKQSGTVQKVEKIAPAPDLQLQITTLETRVDELVARIESLEQALEQAQKDH